MQYLDPGAASIIIQGLIAGVIGVGAFLKLYWKRVRVFFKAPPTEPPEE